MSRFHSFAPLFFLFATLTSASLALAGPTASRPSPYPAYRVGNTATLIITTNPAQPNQTVYRWRYKDGAPDGAQPTAIGTTDSNGRFQVSATIPASIVGRYTSERFAVGSQSGPRSSSLSYRIDAANSPSTSRPYPYPNYDVGDTARLEVRTNPAQPNQKVFRWRYKNGSPDGSQPTEIGRTNGGGVLIVEGVLGISEIGRYTSERFAVGTTTGPRSFSRSYSVHADYPPIVSRPSPFPSYFVGDFSVMNLSTSPAQPNQPVYRWRNKNGSPDGAQPTQIGTTNSSGRLTVSGTLNSSQIGSYTGERFAVGTTGGPRSGSLTYTISAVPTVAAPIVSRPSPYPSYQVGDVATLSLSTNPVQAFKTVYRWRYKNGSPDGSQPTAIGTTNSSGRLTVTGTLNSANVGNYTGERFAVGRTNNPRSLAIAYTVSDAPPPEPPEAFRPAPYPNYIVGNEATLILTTDPPQPDAPIYRYRLRNNLPDGAQPTYLGTTDATGRFESRAVLPAGSEGFYSDEKFSVGAPDNPTSAPLNYNVLDPSTPLAAPTVSRDTPFPNYNVGDIARLVLTTDPIQPNQPVYRWRLKDGEDDGAQPTLIGTTNGFGRLTIEVGLPAEAAGSYTGERFAVGSPEGLKSQALAYVVSPIATGEIAMTSVEPTDFNSGDVTVATIRGVGFTNRTRVDLEAAASPYVDTRVLSVSADGTEMSVEVDATNLNPDAGGVTMLFATEGTKQKAQPVRFIEQGPVVDVWTPTVPYAGSTFVLTLLGHHLDGVSVTPSNPNVLSVRVMTTSDRRVFGLITVADHAPEGPQTLTVTRGGKSDTIEMYVLPARDPSVQQENLLETSSVAAQAKAAGQPVPELLLQRVGINPDLVQQTLELEERAFKAGFTFSFSITWRFIYPILRQTITFDVDTGEVGEIARILGIGDQLRLGAFTFSLTGELYIHFQWRYNSVLGWSRPLLCVEILIAAEVPGATRTVTFSGCWVFGGGSGQSPGFTTMANIQGGECAEAVTTDIIDGVGYSTVTQTDCCEQPLDVRMAGETFGFNFDDTIPDIGTTEPEPDCQTTPTCAELELSVDQIDPQFAPSAERLEFAYTIFSEEFGAPTFTKMEVFKNGDTTNPIFVHDTLPANERAQNYVGQDGVQGWDGKDSGGQWIHPNDSPFTIRISASETSDYQDACVVEQTFEVKVHSVEVTPNGPQKLIKPSRAATEVDKQATATVNLTDKNGGAVKTEIPIKLEWSFEDPDDTSIDPVVDMNDVNGDDNAPVANGGKNIKAGGGASTMWKAEAGHNMTLTGMNQTAEMETLTSGNDKGQAKIKFSASAIGGDNYILVAKTQDAGTAVDGRSDTWTVRKTLAFTKIYRMPGGADVATIMSTANINPAFNGDGHTDYTLSGAAVGINDEPYIATILPPNAAETPTAAEIAGYGMGTVASRDAIQVKAKAWYDRNRADMDTKLNSYITNNNIPSGAVVGAKYWHEKVDGDFSTGITMHYPAANVHFPLGIQVQNSSGNTVSANGEWHNFQGLEILNTAMIFLNTVNPARLQIVGRHEAGHGSDHHTFGLKDHCPAAAGGLMTSNGAANTFSSKGILRLRGWTP